MRNGRLIGVGLSIIGFGIAVIAGLFLAVQVSNSQLDAGGTVSGALVAFVPVALCIGLGIYLYVTSSPQEEEEEPVSTVRQQRELLDILRSRGQVTLAEMAQSLDVSVDDVTLMVQDLIRLQVFNGEIDWEAGILYSTDASSLLDAP